MTDLFLIAHKVRGEPAFDVAYRMSCAVCHATNVDFEVPATADCHECEGIGYWWMVHGRRAYPYWHTHFNQIDWEMFRVNGNPVPDMPSALPDHYTTRAASPVPTGLAALLAKRKPINVERRGR